jgi:CheY-like chemotaxis protein
MHDHIESTSPRPDPLVLIADDNPRSRELLRTVLEQDGYVVLEYTNGTDALAAAKRHKPDLMLLDLRMPGHDGFEVLSGVRAMPHLSSSPVVALTASAMRGDRERILAAGFTEYLSKPIHVAELRRVLAELIGSRLND